MQPLENLYGEDSAYSTLIQKDDSHEWHLAHM